MKQIEFEQVKAFLLQEDAPSVSYEDSGNDQEGFSEMEHFGEIDDSEIQRICDGMNNTGADELIVRKRLAEAQIDVLTKVLDENSQLRQELKDKFTIELKVISELLKLIEIRLEI